MKCSHFTCHQCTDSETIALRTELEELRAKLQEARQEVSVQNKACAEEMLAREHMQRNWDAIIAGSKHQNERVEYYMAENAQLRSQLCAVDFYLDEFGVGACAVPPTSETAAIPGAVDEAMTTLRTQLAKCQVTNKRTSHFADLLKSSLVALKNESISDAEVRRILLINISAALVAHAATTTKP